MSNNTNQRISCIEGCGVAKFNFNVFLLLMTDTYHWCTVRGLLKILKIHLKRSWVVESHFIYEAAGLVSVYSSKKLWLLGQASKFKSIKLDSYEACSTGNRKLETLRLNAQIIHLHNNSILYLPLGWKLFLYLRILCLSIVLPENFETMD